MKPCPFCAEQIQDAAIKCRFCNSMLFQAPALPSAPVGAEAAVLPPGEARPEEPVRVLFEGSPSWRSRFLNYVGVVAGALAAAALAGTAFVQPANLTPPAPHITRWVGLGLLGVGVVAVLVMELLRRAERMRISTQTIDLESGILSKRIQTLQLWRVREIDYAQSLGERLLGISRIHIGAGDKLPELVLRGLPSKRDLFLALRDAVGIARQSKNVLGLVE